jgi:hypothetical protein
MFEFSKMIYNNNFSSKKFTNFLTKNNLVIADLKLNLLTLEQLQSKIDLLDNFHQTCGNYLILNKNLFNDLIFNL